MINSSCRLDTISGLVQVTTTWSNCPLWNSGARGQPSFPIFVTSQSSVSRWQLCYPATLPLPPTSPPHPPLLEPRKKPSAELAFRRFFLKYQFPFVPRQPPIRAGVCWVWWEAGIVFHAPGGKVVHLLFFLIRFPAILQERQRLQLLLSAVNGGPPCLRTCMLIF